MTQLGKRKPLYWLLIDFIATLILLAGLFKLVDLDIPYISDLFREFSTTLLLTVGAIITIVSMSMFLIPIIKANKEKQASTAVERTKR